MTTPYTLFADLAREAPVPARGILSQTLSNEGGIEFLLFAFAAGEQLSEHTSARPAIIHILDGEGELTVDGDTHPARPGTWLRMEPEVKHSLVARTPGHGALPAPALAGRPLSSDRVGPVDRDELLAQKRRAIRPAAPPGQFGWPVAMMMNTPVRWSCCALDCP